MDTDAFRSDGGDRSDSPGCPKCGHTEVEAVSMATADGIVGSVIDIPAEEFTVVSCQHCGFSELYRDTDADGTDPRDLFSS